MSSQAGNQQGFAKPNGAGPSQPPVWGLQPDPENKVDHVAERSSTLLAPGTGKQSLVPKTNHSVKTEIKISESLEDLQTADQRRVLDTIAQIRKAGLDGFLSLPQIVVCGDQSAGKSSVLEALTEIPFPRSDNLCTRHATEIILQRAPTSSLTVKVIPDSTRPTHEQTKIKAFTQTITDFDNLPMVMDLAREAMGITADTFLGGAFARDILSIAMKGPKTPQLTLVDIPGLIANATKGVTDADVKMVAEITDHYICQPRTICLAVISATNDHANQPILTKIKKYDPQGDRTLGVITKPDRLSAGSGSESAFISLAKNEDFYFRLGWHVLKNPSYEEAECDLIERNISETSLFRTSTSNVDHQGLLVLRLDFFFLDAI